MTELTDALKEITGVYSHLQKLTAGRIDQEAPDRWSVLKAQLEAAGHWQEETAFFGLNVPEMVFMALVIDAMGLASYESLAPKGTEDRETGLWRLDLWREVWDKADRADKRARGVEILEDARNKDKVVDAKS